MREIRQEIWDGHLSSYPDEIEMIAPFLFEFEITWARYRFAYNTGLSLYFLAPSARMIEMYGFRNEVALFYSSYRKLEPRTIQAIEKILYEEPAKGRVEKLNCILVSEARDVQKWINSYTENVQQTRTIIGFTASQLRQNHKNRWFVTNALSSELYSRDLFDYKLPLEKDAYFFGRKIVIGSYLDAVKRSENRGLFGLRKTGKTSTLYKLKSLIETEELGKVFLYDCKDPSIRKLRWFQLIERICTDIANCYGNNRELAREIKDGTYDEINASATLSSVIGRLRGKIIIIFDEIEYISFKAKMDPHWHSDFIEFWQSFWGCQSKYRNLVGIIAGVNPSVSEIDSINGIQNPLFGIISHEFLKGLEFSEMKEMILELGRKMGLNFQNDALEYLHSRYGGHPYLTRIACSLLNSKANIRKESRPILVSKERLLGEEDERDSALQHYCEHVVSELRQFYPDEYEMLELLSTKQLKHFIELSKDPAFTRHLQSYGLLSEDAKGLPIISIPVVGFYVGIKNARDEGRKTIGKIIPREKRNDWLKISIHSIVNDIRLLEKIIREKGRPLLFGRNSFPEADKLASVRVCDDSQDFESFINVANRCLVESIEVYGKSVSDNKYFWKIKDYYPDLFNALYRIKLYRHDCMHLELTSTTSENLHIFLKVDLEKRRPGDVDDLYFVLQQCVLDGLWTGTQIEIDRLT